MFENSKIGIRVALLFAVATMTTLGASAQNFNDRFEDAGGYSVQAPRGNSVAEYGCNIATINTLNTPTGSDIQVTYTDPGGIVIASHVIGDTWLDEKGHGICVESGWLTGSPGVVVCGQSGNNNMLVSKLDQGGNVLWTTEIEFGSNVSEGLQIIANSRGFLVVGNYGMPLNSQVCAALVDDFGNVSWQFEYPLAGGTNILTDAEMFVLHRTTAVTGTQETGAETSIFVFNIDIQTGYPTVGGGAIYGEPGRNYSAPKILSPSPSPNGTYEAVISFGEDNYSPWQFSYASRLGLLKTNFLDYTIIDWNYFYDRAPVSEVENNALTVLPNGDFAALLTEHTNIGVYQTAILTFQNNGNFTNATSFVTGGHEHAGSMVLGCNDEALITSVETMVGGLSHRKLISDDFGGSGINCDNNLAWSQSGASCTVMTVWPTYNMYTPPSIAFHSWVNNGVNFDVFDCNGMPKALLGTENPKPSYGELAEAETFLLYPNPAANQVNIGGLSENSTVRIYNQMGQVVLTKMVLNSNDQLAIDQLSSGLYTIECTTLSGMVDRQQLIKL